MACFEGCHGLMGFKKPDAKVGNFKVCVCGGAGGIGQPLCMLIASNSHVSELSIYDLTIAMVPAEGVAADLSHLDKKCRVKGYSLDKDDKPSEKLEECLTGCHLVLVPAGLPRRPGMTRADLLGINAGIAKNIVEACAKFCPDAILGLIVNPVNSVVPAMCELYSQKGLDPRKICGVTSLDVVRANKFVHELTGVALESINVPVVGGHAGASILPLFSHVPAAKSIPADQIPALDKRVQDAGTDVVNAKAGKGSATLSMAYAGAKFANAVLSGLAGTDTIECAYVPMDADSGWELPYFATRVTFGTRGVKVVHPIGKVNEHESQRLEEVNSQLLDEIEAGLKYAASTQLATGPQAMSPVLKYSTSVARRPPPSVKVGNFKVCVCGGSGGIGQPLSMLMASNPHVSELCIYDLTSSNCPPEGVAADLSHLEKKCKVTGYALEKDDKPIEKLSECLIGCHLVLLPAGVPRKPGMTRGDLLAINISIAKNIVEACAKFCPDAILGLIVNPVNSVVPAMCELYKQKGLDPRKICGVTSLDVVRANKFVHEITGAPIDSIDVPVVGGHAGTTILPLFSQVPAAKSIPDNQIPALDKHVQDAGTAVVNAKAGKGSATLSMAYAGAKFGNAVLSGLAGNDTIACAYVPVESDGIVELPYFATRVTFGSSGVKKVHPIGRLSEYEQDRFKDVCAQLKDEIDAGLHLAVSFSARS